MPGRVRCFISIDIEDPALVSRITGLQDKLREANARLKLVEPQNLHITLRFLGEVEEELVRAIVGVLEEVEFNAFDIRLVGVGAFPSSRRPRVIWIGVERGYEDMVELSRKVNSALARLRIPKPREEFVPHLTIARVKGYAGRLASLVVKLRHVEVGEMRVDKFRLKKSTLTPRGPVYETLFEKAASSV